MSEPTKLNVGCGPHYARGWTNTDLVRSADHGITPDLVVTPDMPFPFDPGTIERAYCGHVLEHVPWADVPAWLDMLATVLTDDAEVMFVGPDTHEALRLWKVDAEPWGKVAAVIEGTGAYLEHLGAYQPIRWGGDRHHWNCHQDRVAELLEVCGWRDVTVWERVDGRLPETAIRGAGWPLVDGAPCQFAVSAVRP